MATTERKPAYLHVRELRTRVLWCVGVLLLGGVVGYVFRSAVLGWLEYPLGRALFYTSPTGSFEFVMRLCLLVGFLMALPAMVYHLLRFIEPALPGKLSRRLIVMVIGASTGLVVAGVSFGYYVSLPAALHFFNQVGTNNLQALIVADQYFSFVVNYLAVFAVAFQLPLVLLFINRITPLGPTKLRKWRKFVFVGSFVVALVTPSAPDPLSQVILAVPIIALYEVSIGLVWLANRRRVGAGRSVAVAAPLPRPAAAVAAARPVRPAVRPRSYARAAATIDLRGTETAPRRPVHVLDLRPANAS